MSTSHAPTRRAALALLAAAALAGPPTALRAQSGRAVKVYKQATCGCCGGWAQHMRAAGFSVSVVDLPDVEPIKAKLGVPPALASCHTAEIHGYVFEGHVPAPVIKRFLAETPAGKGLAVPGMPIGSPGMEGGAPETYEVILFGPNGHTIYARCRGAREI